MPGMERQAKDGDSSLESNGLSLSQALRENRLEDFIRQEEERGVAPVKGSDFDRALKLLVRPRQSAGQTSRSPSGGGSTGK